MNYNKFTHILAGNFFNPLIFSCSLLFYVEAYSLNTRLSEYILLSEQLTDIIPSIK